MKVSVGGYGWISASGAGLGRGGSLGLSGGELQLPPPRSLAFTEPFMRYGRLDGFSRLGLSTVALALRDAGAKDFTEKRPFGLYATTRTGCSATDRAYFQTLLDNGAALASPNLFAYTLANCFLGEAAIRFGLTGPAVVLNEAGNQPLASLRWALSDLQSGACSAALAGYCDLPPEQSEKGFSLFLFLLPDPSPEEKKSLVFDGNDLTFAGQRVESWAGFLDLAKTAILS